MFEENTNKLMSDVNVSEGERTRLEKEKKRKQMEEAADDDSEMWARMDKLK